MMPSFDLYSGAGGVLTEVLARRATALGDKPFVESDEGVITYADMDDEASRVAAGLQRLGISAGARVAVLMRNRREFLAAMFGILRGGFVYVPCSTHYAVDELRWQLGHSGATAVIVDGDNIEKLNDVLSECPDVKHVITCSAPPAQTDGSARFEDMVATRLDDGWVPPRLDPEELALIMYTSGTTSRPKGIMLQHGSLVTQADRVATTFEWRSDDRFLHYFPLFHGNGGLTSLLPAIYCGATVVMIPKFSASRFSKLLAEHRITFCHVNATHAKMIMSHPETPTDRTHGVRRMFLGLTLDEESICAFEARFNTKLCPGYGLTEALGLAVGTPPSDLRTLGRNGRPRKGLSFRIVDSEGRDLPAGEAGEVLIRGNQRFELSAGYYNDPDQTEEAFRDGWLRTGDLGAFDEDGLFSYEGRTKDMIKRSGFSIGVAEIERVVGDVPGVAGCAVVGVPDPMREEAIVVYVEPEDGAVVGAEEVLAACRVGLAEYKHPQAVEIVNPLPRDYLGKLDRKALRARAREIPIIEVR